jgi:hypothetical protein
MVNYTCDLCGKYFKKKSSFIKHVGKKKPCSNRKEIFQCKKCLNIYNHHSSLYRHSLVCNKNLDNNLSENNTNIISNNYKDNSESDNNSADDYNSISDYNSENNSDDNKSNNDNILIGKLNLDKNNVKLTNKMDSLTNKMDSLTNMVCQIIEKDNKVSVVQQNKIVINNNSNNNNINVNNIPENNNKFFIKNYQNSFICEEDMIDILNDSEPVMKGIEKIYCNKNRPENHSILTTDKTRNDVLVYENGEWINKNKNYFYRNVFNHVALQIDNLIKKENNLDDNNGIYNTFNNLSYYNNITYKGHGIKNFVKEKKYFYNPFNNGKVKVKINNIFYNSRGFVAITKIRNNTYLIMNE